MAVEIAGLVLTGLGLWWWSRRRRPRTTPRHRPQPARSHTDLASLKALGQKRIADMQGARFELLSRTETAPPSPPSFPGASRSLAGRWWKLCLKVSPADARVRWWPCGITVENPEFLKERDAQFPGPPGQVLHLQLQAWVEGHSLQSSLTGPQTVEVVAYIPEVCQSLEIGYYGQPFLALSLA